MPGPGQAEIPDCVHAKGILAGAATLQEAADKAHSFAAWLDELVTLGYELAIPVGDDYAFLREPEQ